VDVLAKSPIHAWWSPVSGSRIRRRRARVMPSLKLGRSSASGGAARSGVDSVGAAARDASSMAAKVGSVGRTRNDAASSIPALEEAALEEAKLEAEFSRRKDALRSGNGSSSRDTRPGESSPLGVDGPLGGESVPNAPPPSPAIPSRSVQASPRMQSGQLFYLICDDSSRDESPPN
jgi:hypothetical protein